MTCASGDGFSRSSSSASAAAPAPAREASRRAARDRRTHCVVGSNLKSEKNVRLAGDYLTKDGVGGGARAASADAALERLLTRSTPSPRRAASPPPRSKTACSASSRRWSRSRDEGVQSALDSQTALSQQLDRVARASSGASARRRSRAARPTRRSSPTCGSGSPSPTRRCCRCRRGSRKSRRWPRSCSAPGYQRLDSRATVTRMNCDNKL